MSVEVEYPVGTLVRMARYDGEVGRVVGVEKVVSSRRPSGKRGFHATGPVLYLVLRKWQGYAVRMNPDDLESAPHPNG